jgi:hypothetical protein
MGHTIARKKSGTVPAPSMSIKITKEKQSTLQ